MTRQIGIGIDSGTSGTKACAYGEDGKLIVASDVFGGYPILGDGIGSSEQELAAIKQAVFAALRDLTGRLSVLGYVSADLLAGAMAATFQMHTSVPLDENYQPVRDRVILWNNAVGGEFVKQMIFHFGLSEVIKLTNNHPTTGYSLIHTLLVKHTLDQAWQKARRVGLLNSLFGYWLTGRHVLNWNDAAGTIAFDVANNRWSPEIADWAKVPAEFWPDVIAPDGLVGEIRGIFEETGIPDGMRLYGGLGDCAAGALGCGVVTPGQACAILGTAGIFVVPTANLIVDEQGGGRVQSYNYVAGRSHLLSTNLSAGACFEQFRRLLLRLKPGEVLSDEELNRRLSFAALDAEALAVPFGNDALLIDTRIAGERTGMPGWKPNARGNWLGLTPTTTAAEVYLAMMKGVVFNQMMHAAICTDLGVAMNDITLMGGGTKSPFYAGLLAAGMKAVNPEAKVRILGAGQGGGARGMALLALKGAGVITDLAAVAADVERGEALVTTHPTQGLDMTPEMSAQYQRWIGRCYNPVVKVVDHDIF